MKEHKHVCINEILSKVIKSNEQSAFVKEFRPSLTTSSKMMSKSFGQQIGEGYSMDNLMKKVLFIKDREILDFVLLACETLEYYKSIRKREFFSKWAKIGRVKVVISHLHACNDTFMFTFDDCKKF